MCFGPSAWAAVLVLDRTTRSLGSAVIAQYTHNCKSSYCLMAMTAPICSPGPAASAQARNLFDEHERATLATALIPTAKN